MSMLKFTNTMLYVLGMLISNYPTEEATINEGHQFYSIPKNICILPSYPEHGAYTATSGLEPGDAVVYTTLTYSCDDGYSLKGERSPICVRGVWVTELPTCESHCKPLKSNTVDFKCYKQYTTTEISCDSPQDNHSRAKATCKESYQMQPPPKDLICTDGQWDYIPYCTPECGTLAPEAQKLVINGTVAKIGEFPWHLGLYDKTATPIKQLCGGNIFSPNLVVTAAHCVYKDQAGLYPASTFAVAAGKLYRRWNSPEDEKYVQKADVIKIEIPEVYKGAINAFTADIAVLILDRSFVFSSFVRPVCISFDYSDNLNGQLGRVAGWGLTAENGLPSRTLQTVRLPIVRSQECFDNSPERFRPLLLSDKICAGYINGTALCTGDSGGGLVLARRIGDQDHYHLYGIVSTSARNEELNSCSAKSYTAFTNLKVHQQWFQHICLLEWGCENGGCISYEQRCHGGVNYCLDGRDEPGFCSAVNSSTSKDTCVLPEYPRHGNYSATVGLKPGDAVSYTSLTYSCNEGFRLKGQNSSFCVGGTWVGEVPTCEKFEEEDNKACGRISSRSGESGFEKPITIKGTDVKFIELRWLIKLYGTLEEHCALGDSGCWQFQCIGSLISSKVVLTAAECSYINIKQKARTGDWNLDTSEEPLPYQERLVTKVIRHPSYSGGFIGTYDVALLVVDSLFTSADNVDFICLPPPNLNMTSASCKLASFTWAEEEEHRKFVYLMDLNFINRDQCQRIIREDYDPSYVLPDTLMCSNRFRYNGTLRSFRSSPLMCFAEDHYYLRSFSSWNFLNYNSTAIVMIHTDVVKVRNWIDEEMNANGFTTDTYTHVAHRN